MLHSIFVPDLKHKIHFFYPQLELWASLVYMPRILLKCIFLPFVNFAKPTGNFPRRHVFHLEHENSKIPKFVWTLKNALQRFSYKNRISITHSSNFRLFILKANKRFFWWIPYQHKPFIDLWLQSELECRTSKGGQRPDPQFRHCTR